MNAKKLALGTVQFGLNYGVSNSAGQVPPEEVGRILACAQNGGVDLLDTAEGYGNSEAVLGAQFLKPFRLVTKIAGLKERGVPATGLENFLLKSVEDSLYRLRQKKTHAILLHKEVDLLEYGAPLWRALEEIKKRGLTEKVGFSTHWPEKFRQITKSFVPDIIQCPYNLLDHRYFSAELPEFYRRQRIEVHTRSAFLQGLLFLGAFPEKMKFAESTLVAWRELAAEIGCTLPQLSLCYALRQPLAEKAVIGVTSAKELAEILAWPEPAKLPMEEIAALAEKVPLKVIDPTLW